MGKKKCSRCGRILSLSYFYRRLGTPDGLQYWCKECKYKRQLEFREQNPMQNNLACARYYDDHRESFRVRNANRKAALKGVVGRINLGEWMRLLERHSGICPACGCLADLQVDHVNPFSKGGPNLIANIQPLCQQCNSRKHTKVVRY